MFFEVLKLISAVIFCNLTGIIGSLFSVKNVDTWYQTINKPVFNPPDWVFAPVWMALYTLMGISLYLVASKGINKTTALPLVLFFIQLLLNACWSPVFFGLKNIFGAFVIIILMLLFIALTILAFFKVSKAAAYLLIPYFLWVSYATVLNFYLLKLN